MLGKKQNVKNEEWLDAVSSIEQTVTREEVELLVATAIEDIHKHIKGIKAAYAWSAGKDSIVLGHVCERAGITDSLIGVCNLEYPTFMRWIVDNKPEGCEIINTGQDLEWLVKHPDMLFPRDSAKAARWFSIVQHTAQRQYVKKHGIDILILGRRKADGNYVGKGSNIYTDMKGITRYSPLANWRHEDVLAYIHYHELSLPPIYDWYNGYKCGTHPWPARQWTQDTMSAWAEVYAIDQSIVIGAAKSITSAAEYLEAKK